MINGEAAWIDSGAAVRVDALPSGEIVVQNAGNRVYIRSGSATYAGTTWERLASLITTDNASWFIVAGSWAVFRWAIDGNPTDAALIASQLVLNTDGTVLARTASGVKRRLGSLSGLGTAWESRITTSTADGADWFLGTDNAAGNFTIYRWAVGGIPQNTNGEGVQLNLSANGDVYTVKAAGEMFIRPGSALGLGTAWQAVATAVTNMVVNSGAVQHSRITRIDITFATPVDVSHFTASGAVTLSRGSTLVTTGTGLIISPATGLVTSLTLRLADAILDGIDSGSLADDRWRLNIIPAAYQSALNDNRFTRLFAVINADGTINGADLVEFGNSFGANITDSPFDFDNDGTINGSDHVQLGNRFGVSS
ncbi:hypothetical protein BH11PLA2_BH11PLA2_26910 [soil metagenome]